MKDSQSATHTAVQSGMVATVCLSQQPEHHDAFKKAEFLVHIPPPARTRCLPSHGQLSNHQGSAHSWRLRSPLTPVSVEVEVMALDCETIADFSVAEACTFASIVRRTNCKHQGSVLPRGEKGQYVGFACSCSIKEPLQGIDHDRISHPGMEERRSKQDSSDKPHALSHQHLSISRI